MGKNCKRQIGFGNNFSAFAFAGKSGFSFEKIQGFPESSLTGGLNEGAHGRISGPDHRHGFGVGERTIPRPLWISLAALPVGIRFGPACVLHQFATVRTVAEPELIKDFFINSTGEAQLRGPFAIPPAERFPRRKIIRRGCKIEIVVSTFALRDGKQDLLLEWGGVGDAETQTPFSGFLSDKGNP